MAFEFLLFQNFTLTCKTIFRQLVYRQKLSCSVFKDSFRDDERGKVLFKRSVCSCNYKKDNFDPKAAQLTAWFKWHRGAVVCRALCKWHTGRLTKTVCLGPDKKGGKNDPGYKLYWLPVLFCKRQTGRVLYLFDFFFTNSYWHQIEGEKLMQITFKCIQVLRFAVTSRVKMLWNNTWSEKKKTSLLRRKPKTVCLELAHSIITFSLVWAGYFLTFVWTKKNSAVSVLWAVFR